MCGRYRRTTAQEELVRRYHIPIPPQRDLPILMSTWFPPISGCSPGAWTRFPMGRRLDPKEQII
jgi:hypothetical protein